MEEERFCLNFGEESTSDEELLAQERYAKEYGQCSHCGSDSLTEF